MHLLDSCFSLCLDAFNIKYHLFTIFYLQTYCLSQFTYGLGTVTLNSKTNEYLNIAQNNLLRQMIELKSRCHMSNILKCLKIFNFGQLYLQSKLSFIETLKYNYLASQIFHDLSINPRIKGSRLKSFDQDITILEDFFKSNIFKDWRTKKESKDKVYLLPPNINQKLIIYFTLPQYSKRDFNI
ncbi:hypothetical protein BpHYR1_049432 [Brachionus plicatilis]|uniref:RNA-directed DNA polymerase from mobile element jockey-like n=1 Tax=Brachionus plicatilis TaxID=10195 RepID=A0A3M7R334_BRAPC|nr:hypothetical protein BpHYR1_049432 [Brachionus plicatilis]